MSHIVMLDSPKEDLFICGYCKIILTSLPLFLDHKRECEGTVSFHDENTSRAPENNSDYSNNMPRNISTECSYEINVDSEKDDANSLNKQGEVSCKVCNKTFKMVKSLTVHLRSHNSKPYQCLICGRCFTQSSHLKRHELTHKVWPNGLSETTANSVKADISSYCCMYCDETLSSYGQFRIHLKNHGSLKKFKCIQKECHNLFEDIDLLLQHVALVHTNARYKCSICHKVFHTLEEIAIHQQNHDVLTEPVTEANKYKCNQCDAIFKKKEKLELHLSTENHNKTCVHCSKAFASHKRLRLHLQIHKTSKPFQCNVCSQSFSLKKYLTTHMAKHSERQFTCSICNYKFKRKDILQRHTKTHVKKKIFKCPFKEALGCKMEFSRSDKLNLHVRNHTKQMTVNPKRERRKKGNHSSTIEIMIVPLDGKGCDDDI